MDDTLHRADLAPDLGKGGLDLRGVCNVTTVGVKRHAQKFIRLWLAAAVQQHHACAAVLVNLPRKGLAHAAKAASNHHAACTVDAGSGHGRRLQAGKLAHTHRAIGSNHIRAIDVPKAGRQSRHACSSGIRF